MIQVELRPYTKIQQAFIDGNVDIADVSCAAISCLLHKAKEIEYHQVVQLAEKLHKIKQKKYVKKQMNAAKKPTMHERRTGLLLNSQGQKNTRIDQRR